MSGICATIASDILINCTSPIVGGTKDLLYIFNFDDILNAVITRNSSNTQIVENIVFSSGATGYKIEGQNNSLLPKNSMRKGRFINSFDHEVNFKTFSLNPTVKAALEKVAKGRFVCIVENIYKGDAGEAAFEIYGLDSGLICSTLDRDPGNNDTQGAYDIILKSSEQSPEPHLPATYFKTDYATTKALIVGVIG